MHICGLIVSSDSTFFQNLSPEDTRRFFEASKAFLTGLALMPAMERIEKLEIRREAMQEQFAVAVRLALE